MDAKKTRVPQAATGAIGARTIVMDRPPDMTMALGPECQEELRLACAGRVSPSKTPSMMATSIFQPDKQKRVAAQPPPPPRPIAPPPAAPAAPPPAVEQPMLPRAAPPLTMAPPPSPPSPAKRGALRTRMVDLRDALENPGHPPLPTHLAGPQGPSFPSPARPPAFAPYRPPGPSPQAGFRMPAPSRRARWRAVLATRWPFVCLVAGVLAIAILVPFLGGENAQAQAAAAQAAASPAALIEPPAAPISPPAPVEIMDQSGISEARAGAALLSGQRAKALQIYRALAKRPNADPAIHAMVLVLEQKVVQP